MKRIISLCAAVLLALGLVACTGGEAPAGSGPNLPDVQQTPRSEQVDEWTPANSMIVSGALAAGEAYMYVSGSRVFEEDGEYFYYDIPSDISVYDFDFDADEVHTSRGAAIGTGSRELAAAYADVGCLVLHEDMEEDEYAYASLAAFLDKNPGVDEYYVLYNWMTADGVAITEENFYDIYASYDSRRVYGYYGLYFYVADGSVAEIEFYAET